MVIHKKDLGDDWPFTVDEVEVIVKIRWCCAYAIKYNNSLYALSGVLESCGFIPLEQSGIWSDDPEIPGAKKSITPLMEFLRKKETI